jgi:hypothetical protein
MLAKPLRTKNVGCENVWANTRLLQPCAFEREHFVEPAPNIAFQLVELQEMAQLVATLLWVKLVELCPFADEALPRE